MILPRQISVIIPCYNAARYVGASLRSVLAQEGVALEVIMVDDGSSDGSAEFVEKAFPTVRILRQSNQGVAAARNLGIQEAAYEWIAFLDADDLWMPGKLQAQVELLQLHARARMVYTAWQVWASEEPQPQEEFLEKLRAESFNVQRWQGASGWIYPQLLLDCVVWTSTVLIHRSVLDEVGTFDPALRVGEDYDLWLRASRVTPILRVCSPLALYRKHVQSITRRVPERNYKGEVIARALQRWGYQSPDGGRASVPAIRRGLARSWSDFASAHLIAGNFGEAWEAARKALYADPTHVLAWTVLAKALSRSFSKHLFGTA